MKTIPYALMMLLAFYAFEITAQEALPLNSTAPNFVALDQNGEGFSLEEALRKGPVIISFHRGSWCRYCIKQFREIQSRYSEITQHNAQFVAITPDEVAGIQKTISLVQPSFKIIRDVDLKISYNFKALSEEKFSMFEGDLDSGREFLPVPATYVIGQDSKIKYAFFDINYKVRAILDDVIKSLKH